MPDAGFTVVELAVTIAIIGIIAAVAATRMMDRGGFDSRGFYDASIAAVRLAQKSAIAQRRVVKVTVTGTAVSACYLASATSACASACAADVIDPVTGAALNLQSPTPQVTFTAPSTFCFDALGAASAAQAFTVASSAPGDINRSFSIEAATGYVHP